MKDESKKQYPKLTEEQREKLRQRFKRIWRINK